MAKIRDMGKVNFPSRCLAYASGRKWRQYVMKNDFEEDRTAAGRAKTSEHFIYLVFRVCSLIAFAQRA